MKNWKKAIALVASAAALVSVAACGSSNAGGSSDSGKKTVGFVAVGPEGGFRTANEKDIQKAFEDAGFDLTYSPTQNNDQQKQIQAFNKFVNDEVDAIILSSTEDSGWDDSLKKAAEAEIPVFTVDRNVRQGRRGQDGHRCSHRTVQRLVRRAGCRVREQELPGWRQRLHPRRPCRPVRGEGSWHWLGQQGCLQRQGS